MSKKVVIVGGVAGGATTAARLRRMDEFAEIIIVERGPYISFANCGLPYHISDVIEDRDDLLLQTPEAMHQRFNIDVRVSQEVTDIDTVNKTVSITQTVTGATYTESYDVLVLSPGSSPLRPPIPGINRENVFTLWNIPDMDRIKVFVKENNLKTATVVGGGFIGLEMAENLKDLGLDVSIAEMLDQVMAPVDFDMAQIVHQHLKEKGIDLHLNNGVDHFHVNAKDSKRTDVVLKDGTVLTSDLIILSIGVRPNNELGKKANLKMNQRGGIVVNQYMQTSQPDIYALGDAVEIEDFMTKSPTMVPLAGPANKQGRIVANHIVGMEDAYTGTQGTSVVKVFDLTVASTGMNEKTLIKGGRRCGKEYHVAFIPVGSHAGYYPGASTIYLKLLFDNDGLILGAQGIGKEGVDKRIDVIATAIRFRGKVSDLKQLELGYAPPFSSAKDPVNMIGFVAENILSGKMQAILPRDIAKLDLKEVQLLDVRTEEEHKLGAINPSLLIPVDELRQRLDELDKNKTIAIYCAAGLRGYIASNILKANGFKAMNLMGGYSFYELYKQEN